MWMGILSGGGFRGDLVGSGWRKRRMAGTHLTRFY